MKCIVPLAGADFFRPEYGIKPLVPVDGVPLLEKVLAGRPWVRSGELRRDDCIFVLRQGEGVAQFRAWLSEAFPASPQVVLSHPTGGALLSALAGASVVTALDEPLIVDLADILFTSDMNVTRLFDDEPELAGVIPYFESTESCYSYLQMDGSLVTRTAEKQVISTHASAGTYLFRSVADYTVAVAGSLAAGDAWTHRGIHFVCPAFNALIAAGRRVRGVAVADVVPVSAKFHPTSAPST